MCEKKTEKRVCENCKYWARTGELGMCLGPELAKTAAPHDTCDDWEPKKMGLFKGVSECGCGCSSAKVIVEVREKIKYVEKEPRLPNPNPENFQIIYWEEYYGKYVIAEIVYPDCTNYEGHKVCVFEATYEELTSQKFLDPHFCENNRHISPIARFIPTERGLKMAQKFIESMLEEENDNECTS